MDSCKIVALEAENVKRLRAIHIVPSADDPVVVIGGRNAQGKSSALDSILYAVGGADALPEQPLRHGEETGFSKVDLGDIIVTRTFRENGKSKLTVVTKEGAPVAGPQTVLDRLYSACSFDPLEFQRMKPADRAEVLRKLVGLDTTVIDSDITLNFNRRTEVNRSVKSLEARIAAMPKHDRKYDTALSVDALQARLIEEQKKQSSFDEVDRQVERWADETGAWERKVEEAKAALARCEASLAEAQKNLDDAFDRREAMEPGNTVAVMAEMQTVSEHNKKHAENSAYSAVKMELSSLSKKSDELSDVIDKLRTEKEKVVADAKFPVPGLSFGDSGVMYFGVPFEQASAAEKMRISLAIGAALNPKLRVALIRDGSLLDDDSMDALRELAAEYDMQVWIERVGTRDENAVIIEDGEVVEGGI